MLAKMHKTVVQSEENVPDLRTSPSNTKEVKTDTPSASSQRKTEVIDGLNQKNNEILECIRAKRQKGKQLQMKDISAEIDMLVFLLARLHSNSLKLSEKFQTGEKICSDICKEGTLFDDMWMYCVKNRNNLPKITAIEHTIWAFFMNSTMFSPEICMKLAKANGFLSYGRSALDSLCKPFKEKRKDVDITTAVKAISATIHNMCAFCESTISIVRAAGFLPVYMKYINSERLHEDLLDRVPFVAAASDIMNESDGSLVGSRAEIEFMMCGIEESIQCVSGQFNGWMAFELGKVLGQLAVFDCSKRILVEYGVLTSLNKLAKQEEEIEQLAAMRALAHLVFDEENRKTLMKEENLDVLQTLFSLAKTSALPAVRESAKGVLWTLSDNLQNSKKYAADAIQLFQKASKGHIMISYSREQRPLLLQIKQVLTEAGFTVWMDIEQMRDNVYDRMAEAIQNASVVLISMSYSYQRSEYCRREAAYASSLKRARIPLLVDKNYSAEGWLALMTAGDYHYDFVNKPFDTKVIELRKELERRTYQNQEPDRDTSKVPLTTNSTGISSSLSLSNPSSHGQPNYSQAASEKAKPDRKKKHSKRWKEFEKMKKEDFLIWLERNKLPRDIFEQYRPEDIVFLAQMKEEAPEAFYKYVMKLAKTKDKLASLRIATDFSRALEHLKAPKLEEK